MTRIYTRPPRAIALRDLEVVGRECDSGTRARILHPFKRTSHDRSRAVQVVKISTEEVVGEVCFTCARRWWLEWTQGERDNHEWLILEGRAVSHPCDGSDTHRIPADQTVARRLAGLNRTRRKAQREQRRAQSQRKAKLRVE